MLVLTRKKDESIIVGDEIKITVVDVSSNQVQIGIEAPENIEIHREEIYNQIKKENKEASTVEVTNLSDIIKEIENQQKD